jgi:hypothetical protein
MTFSYQPDERWMKACAAGLRHFGRAVRDFGVAGFGSLHEPLGAMPQAQLRASFHWTK